MLLQIEPQSMQSISQIGGNLTVIGVLVVVAYFLYNALIKSSEKRDTKEKELRQENLQASEKRDVKEKELRQEYMESIKTISDAYKAEAAENRNVFRETIDEILASHDKLNAQFHNEREKLLDKILQDK